MGSESQARLSEYLEDGESLRWAGQPEPLLFQPMDKFLVPMSLVWFAIPVVTLVSMTRADGGPALLADLFLAAPGLSENEDPLQTNGDKGQAKKPRVEEHADGQPNCDHAHPERQVPVSEIHEDCSQLC